MSPRWGTTSCGRLDTGRDYAEGYRASRELVINEVYAPESMRHSTRTLAVPTRSHP